jgi:TolB-like protein
MRYKGMSKSLPEITRDLNVDGIVEGSATRSGQRVRITAQLLYGPTDKHLWAETYEGDLETSWACKAKCRRRSLTGKRKRLSGTL